MEQQHFSILQYKPSVIGNIVFCALYAILGASFSFYIARRRDLWALCLPIGAFCSAVGFGVRLTMDPINLNLTTYIVQQAFVVISPSTFLAFNYMLYGRFIRAIDPKFGNDIKSTSKMEKSRFSFIPPLIVGRVFVWSDVITFFIQCAAGGMESAGAHGNADMVNIGDKMFLVGVTAQGLSYVLFTVLLTVALIRLVADRRAHGAAKGMDKATSTIALGFYVSSFFIIVRSVFRIVEFTQGYHGYLIGHEAFLFALDAAPLTLAIGIWAIIWPTKMLEKIAADTRALDSGYAMESGSSVRNGSQTSKDGFAPLH